MKLLEERILKDGHILGDNILKEDSFLTHQVDFSLMSLRKNLLLLALPRS